MTEGRCGSAVDTLSGSGSTARMAPRGPNPRFSGSVALMAAYSMSLPPKHQARRSAPARRLFLLLYRAMMPHTLPRRREPAVLAVAAALLSVLLAACGGQDSGLPPEEV